MRKHKKLVYLILCALFCTGFVFTTAKLFTKQGQQSSQQGKGIIKHTVDPSQGRLHFYWKDSSGNDIRKFGRLRELLKEEHKVLKFAMNGGMYRPSGAEEVAGKILKLGMSSPHHSPVGLYVEEGRKLSSLDQGQGFGNFYMKPNGVFYITQDHQAGVCVSEEIHKITNIRFATQSGPMLVINGMIHQTFKKESQNLKVRNGVGILLDGKVIFILSKTPINFYDFAELFKSAGCKNALYLDGFVSRIYLPEKGLYDVEGDFGVIVAEVQEEN